MTVAELLSQTGLSRPTLERQLDKLQEAGHISSTKGPRNSSIYTLEGED
jgi:DNA-binding MarR family transcriptional regulator